MAVIMKKLVVCRRNDSHEVDLIKGKVYYATDEESGMYRIVDESGEDYLYPKNYFFDYTPLYITIEQMEKAGLTYEQWLILGTVMLWPRLGYPANDLAGATVNMTEGDSRGDVFLEDCEEAVDWCIEKGYISVREDGFALVTPSGKKVWNDCKRNNRPC